VIVKPNTTRGCSRGSVDERRLCEPGAPGEGAGHGRRAADLRRRARGHGCAVGAQHDVRVEHREQRGEVAGAGGGEEGVDHCSLAGEIGVDHRPLPGAIGVGRQGHARTRRRARLASCRAAAGERLTIGAISSKGTAKRSCSTNARRSAGAGVLRTTSSASSSGSFPCSRLVIGPGA
jgi:hypothetical protein